MTEHVIVDQLPDRTIYRHAVGELPWFVVMTDDATYPPGAGYSPTYATEAEARAWQPGHRTHRPRPLPSGELLTVRSPRARVRPAGVEESEDVEAGRVVDHVAGGMTAPDDEHVLVAWSRSTLSWEPVAALELHGFGYGWSDDWTEGGDRLFVLPPVPEAVPCPGCGARSGSGCAVCRPDSVLGD